MRVNAIMEVDQSSHHRARYLLFLVIILVSGLATRLYRIHVPAYVCWDEVHFYKMAALYKDNTHFFDVHPPLGKMLFSLIPYMTNTSDNTSLLISHGDPYTNNTYVYMRMFNAILGSLLPVLSYVLIFKISKGNYYSALLTSIIVLCDTSLLTISRFILLDTMLMIFVVCTLTFHVYFQHQKPISTKYIIYLALTGISMSLAISVKFIGLFVAFYIGFDTISRLWADFGDVTISMFEITKRFIVFAISLILLPVIIYTFIFYVHFKLLSKSGAEDIIFSSGYQSSLQGNHMKYLTTSKVLAYDSIFSVKNDRLINGFLHFANFSNKDWQVKRVIPSEKVLFVNYGSAFIMQNIGLGCFLSVSENSEGDFVVSCSPDNEGNVLFRLQPIREVKGEIQLNGPKFKIINQQYDCAIGTSFHFTDLENQDIQCIPSGISFETQFWNLFHIEDKRLQQFNIKESTFFEKFVEIHILMYQANNVMIAKQPTSFVYNWPFNIESQQVSDDDFDIKITGNQLIWNVNVICLTCYATMRVTGVLIKKRWPLCYSASRIQEVERCDRYALLWLLHYVPFWFIARTVYVHHYLSAFFISCLHTGVFMDVICKLFKTHSGVVEICTLVLIVLIQESFRKVSSFSYGK